MIVVLSICMRSSQGPFFNGWVVFHCVDIPHSLYLFLVEKHLDCFKFLVITNEAAMNIVQQVPLWDSGAPFEYMSMSYGIAGLWDRTIPSLLKKCQNDLENGWQFWVSFSKSECTYGCYPWPGSGGRQQGQRKWSQIYQGKSRSNFYLGLEEFANTETCVRGPVSD